MEDADIGFVLCNYTEAKVIRELRETSDVAQLHHLGYHNNSNAFDILDFGAGNPYGINRATMSENLHTVQKGWYLYALQAFFGGLTDGVKAFLESLVERISYQCRHQSDRNHDWVNVEYYDPQKREFFEVVGQIMFFVDIREPVIPFMSQVEVFVEAGTYAVIHSLESEPTPIDDSCLLTTGLRSKTYNLVSTTAFVDTAFVIDNVGCPHKSVLVVRPNKEWAQLFC